MSTSYGNYLTEEDPNKKKLSEGTTPSTTPTTGTEGTTTPPLTYEGFVGTGSGSQAYQAGVGVINSNYDTAVNTATTNRDLGYEYIEGVKNSIYGNAAAQRAEADKNTEVARQRGIIDSKSSYQKAIGAYGSNAETLAGRGLSGSGYGEYLTADAYATHRGQVQNINADALRANREAAYAENQAKMAADSEYLKNLYGINTEYNNAVNKAESDRTTGMYQAALGLNEDQNAAYGKLFDSASKGVSIDTIMQDGTWGDLTPEQQQAIKDRASQYNTDQNEANFSSWLKGINDGSYTLADIQAMSGYNNLTPAQKTQLEAASTLRGKTEMKDRMSVYAELAAKGTSLEDIKAMMAINGDTYVEELTPEEYDKLSDEEKAAYNEARNFMKLIESAAQKYSSENTNNETLANIDNAIADGATLEEIQGMEGWEDLDPEEQDAYKEQIEDRDEEKEVTIDSFVASLFMPGEEVYSLDDLDTRMRAKGVPSEMREEVISRWQSENATDMLKEIGKAEVKDGVLVVDGIELSAEDIMYGIKNGAFGDRAEEVKAKYLQILSNNPGSLGWALPQFETLGVKASKYLRPAVRDAGLSVLKNGNYEIYGMEFLSEGKVTDKAVLSYLDSVTEEPMSLVMVAGEYYYKHTTASGWQKLNKVGNI